MNHISEAMRQFVPNAGKPEPHRPGTDNLEPRVFQLNPAIAAVLPADPSPSPAADGSPCPVCAGFGYIKYDVPVGHPQFGKFHECPSCFKPNNPQRVERLRAMSRLEAYADKTWAKFEWGRHDAYAQVRGKIEQYAAQIPASDWLLLHGTYGTGKTHIAAAIANDHLAAGHEVLFINTPDLLDQLRQAYDRDAMDSYSATFERVRTVRLLVLDDLGTERQSEWAVEKLYQLFNHRYEQRLPTIITTNRALNDLEPRIASRMQDEKLVHVVELRANDARRGFKGTLPTQRLEYPHTFDKFDTADADGSLKRALEAARSFATMQADNRWLLMLGPSGTGKTHLLAAIANHFGDQYEAPLLHSTALMRFLQQAFDQKSSDLEHRIQRLQRAEILLIDDIGAESRTDWSTEQMIAILDYRLRNDMLTAITQSRSPHDLPNRYLTRLLHPDVKRVKISARPYYMRINRGA